MSRPETTGGDGRALAIRTAWAVVLLAMLALFAAGAVTLWNQMQVVCSDAAPGSPCSYYALQTPMPQSVTAFGLTRRLVASYVTLLDAIDVFGYLGISAVLIWRRPTDRLVVFAAFTLLVFAATQSDSINALGQASPQLSGVVRGLRVLGGVTVGILFCIFPDGRFVPRWTLGLTIALTALLLVTPWAADTWLDMQTWPPAAFVCLGCLVLVAQVYRYRRVSNASQRQQTRWVVFGLGVAVAGAYGPPALENLLIPRVDQTSVEGVLTVIVTVTVQAAGFLALPLSIGIAILRHRLFDIDRIISGAFIYGGLWLGIAAAYLGFTAATNVAIGGVLPAPVGIFFTLMVALLVQPARHRLERWADRWVFGKRLGGYELLARFGASIEQNAEPAELAQRLVSAVRQGLQVNWVRVSLRRTTHNGSILEPVAVDGIGPLDRAEIELSVELVHGPEAVGTIECGPKRRGDAFDVRDRELLATLGRQAALALRNARLADNLAAHVIELGQQAEELAASRTRLVQAEEAGRRRLERDLHDGVQQQLVAMMAKIRLARNQLTRDSPRAENTLAELQEEARLTLHELRELAQGIHPALLGDRGLFEAIEARAARLPLEVRIETEGVQRGSRFAEAIEGAAYFMACEGLTNALKHSATNRACLRLVRTESALTVEVADEGQGFDVARATQRGLRGLADRIEALGGTLSVTSQPGSGTRVLASLPIREPDRG